MAESDETARAEVARFEQYWPAHVRFAPKADSALQQIAAGGIVRLR